MNFLSIHADALVKLLAFGTHLLLVSPQRVVVEGLSRRGTPCRGSGPHRQANDTLPRLKLTDTSPFAPQQHSRSVAELPALPAAAEACPLAALGYAGPQVAHVSRVARADSD